MPKFAPSVMIVAVESTVLSRVKIDCGHTPQEALLALRDDARAFALIGSWAGGGAVLGSEPVDVAVPGAEPFEALDRLPAIDGPLPAGAVGGGWFGPLSYGAGHWAEELPPPPPRPVLLPTSSLAFYDHVLRLDPEGGWWFEALAGAGNEDRLEARLALLRERLESAAPPPRDYDIGPFFPNPGRAGYERAVRTCVGYIEAGDLYQANLTVRLEASVEGKGIDLFARTSAALEPPYSAYFDCGTHEVASLSPELYLRRIGRDVRTAPIKGTIPRPAESEGAKAAAAALSASAKDRAENVMIVDLMRNDLGRVCEYGSVEATIAADPEPHPGLWHLVSSVTGRLRPGVGDGELVRRSFPPGSVTGAPKIKAQEVISELESTGRETYTGAIGMASPVAGLELNVAIRTFEISGDRIWLGAGGGIVADSSPAAEFAEAIAKASPLVEAAGSSILGTEPHAVLARGLPEPIRVPRPDPAAGVIETLLIAGGHPCELDAHLDRLEASVEALYGVGLDRAAAIDELTAQAPEEGDARARLSVMPSGATEVLTATVEVQRVGAPATEMPDLVPVTVPGGLGSHKWADRRLVDSLTAGGAREALICDIDGSVLETGAGNIWIVENGAILTPPADGRILPGVTRDALLALAQSQEIKTRECEIGIERVVSAVEVFATSSIRGPRPVNVGGAPRDRRAEEPLWSLLGRLLATRRRNASRRTT